MKGVIYGKVYKEKEKNAYGKPMAKKHISSSSRIPITIREKTDLERMIIDLESAITFKNEEIVALGNANRDLNSRLRREEESATHYREQWESIQQKYRTLAKEGDELKSAYARLNGEKSEVILALKDVQEKDIKMRIEYGLLLDNTNTKLALEREKIERATAELSQQIQAQGSELEEVFSRAEQLILGYNSVVHDLEGKLSSTGIILSQTEAEMKRLIDDHAVTLQEHERELVEISEELQEERKKSVRERGMHDEYVKWSSARYTAIEENLHVNEGENFKLGIKTGELLQQIRAIEQEKEQLQLELQKVINIHVEDTEKIRKRHQHLVNFVYENKRFRKILFPAEERFFFLANKLYFSKRLDTTELIVELTEQFQEFLETEESKYHYTALKFAEEMFIQQHPKTRLFYDILNSMMLLEMPVYQQLRVGILALIATQEQASITSEEILRMNKILTEISKEDPTLKLNYNNQVLQTAVYACSMMMEENPRARLLAGSYILREQSLKETVDEALVKDARDYLSQSVTEDPSLEGALRMIIAEYAGNIQLELLRTSFSGILPPVKELYVIGDQGERKTEGEIKEIQKPDEKYALNLLLNSTEESAISEAAVIAKILRDEKKTVECIWIYEQLIKIDPNNHHHHYFLATAYEQVNRLGEAKEQYLLAGKGSSASAGLARINQKLGVTD